MSKSTALLNFECVNCGRQAWSLFEVVTCERCGATVVCTTPTVAVKDMDDLTVGETERLYTKVKNVPINNDNAHVRNAVLLCNQILS